jgi:hypothetical protein
MPDVTIPGAMVITIGVIFCAVRAMHTGDVGDYKAAAIAGILGTLANLVFFYRRLHIQAKAEQYRRKQQKKASDEKRAA